MRTAGIFYVSWNLLCKSNANSTAVEFVRVLPLFCGGRKVLQEIAIFRDWSFELKVVGKPVSKEITNSLEKAETKKSFFRHTVWYCFSSLYL